MSFFRRRQKSDAVAAPPFSTEITSTTLQWDFDAPEDNGKLTGGLDPQLYTLHTTSAAEEISVDYVGGYQPGRWSATPLTKAWRTDEADGRLESTRNALDQGLEQWWSDGELLARPLLREGLLALEAGHDLDEGHRTLLLRTALTYQRGMITALRYQTDGERTAFMLKEMLLNLQFPLSPALVWRLGQEDEKSQEWKPLLIEELRYELPLVEGLQYQQTRTTLAYLEGRQRPAESELHDRALPTSDLDLLEEEIVRPMGSQPYWSYGRLLVLALLVALAAGAVIVGWQPSAAVSAIAIPADTYPLRSADDAQLPRLEKFAAFAIDRSEVTNRAYQRCYRAGVCPPLPTAASLTRPNYFTDPAFADFPVVNVTWAAAQAYCGWQGKTLPTVDQWQVAASVAPATRRAARYPWGDPFDRLLANTAASGFGDTQPVGSYHPNGDSGYGLLDMAGNVAEWTASPVAENSQEYIVKGGSFHDDPPAAAVTAQQTLNGQFYAPWLGFRCSVALPE